MSVSNDFQTKYNAKLCLHCDFTSDDFLWNNASQPFLPKYLLRAEKRIQSRNPGGGLAMKIFTNS